MEFKDLYRRWRWITYNQLEWCTLKQMANGELPIPKDDKYPDNIYFVNYTEEKIKKFKNKDFNVSDDIIRNYNTKIRQKVKELNGKYNTYNLVTYPRSEFIENCLINTNQYDYDKLNKKIKKNIILYYWWDEFNFNELSENIISIHFLRSTSKLIPNKSLHKYFETRFKEKDEFIKYLLQHFEPRKKMIDEMNTVMRNDVVFDYGWLFYNDLKKSIRIFENECRLDHNEKIIGSFYNENVLFREIKRKYERSYTIVSQGSPEWLGLQRFDIYFPELNIAIEYQGEQHQRPIDFGGKGKKIAKKQFQENLIRDEIKRKKAKENDCKILFVYPNYDLKDLINSLNIEIRKKTVANKS